MTSARIIQGQKESELFARKSLTGVTGAANDGCAKHPKAAPNSAAIFKPFRFLTAAIFSGRIRDDKMRFGLRRKPSWLTLR